MAVTAVPLRPVAKGALTTLWLGILALLAVGVGFAMWTTDTERAEIEFTVVTPGKGPSPTDDDVVLVKYEGKLADGTVFDAQEQAPFPVKAVVPGFSQALKRMQKGGKYTVVIPPTLGYGPAARGPIPANSTLTFTVELLDFKSEAEVRAMQEQMQQLQQMIQQEQGGGPAGQGAPAGQ